MKITFTFDHEEASEAKTALRAMDLATALDDIHTKLLRPSYKHGYPDQVVQEALERSEDAQLVMEYLCKLYWEVIEDHGLRDLI